MSVVFTVRSVPGSERLEHWQEEVFRTFVPLRITLPKGEPIQREDQQRPARSAPGDHRRL
ncbi:hypothetical protein ACFY1B_48455 [Streptomyces mirabilis]|uniref:hypothetical protein n=1 Tax=Streptomyces mirabilis TaxID=68239 RepID=UPI00367437D1